MTKISEPDTTEKPAWLDLPEKESYWVCMGTPPKRRWWKRSSNKVPKWSVLFYTKEDAEAHACIPCESWIWDKNPAVQMTLNDCMFMSRQAGRLGVKVLSHQNDKWVVVRKYPTQKPLPI